MRSRAGFFWCSLWLTLLLLLPLILVVGFLARQRQTQQELRQAAANQSQLQIEPGAQSVWRMLHEPFGPHGAEEETEELWTDLSEVPETAYEQDPKRRINSDTDMPFDPSLLPTDPGLGEGPL